MFLFTLVLLVFCWWSDNHSIKTKIFFSILVLASFGLSLVPEHRYLFHVTQLVLIIVIGASTFGVEWLNQRIR